MDSLPFGSSSSNANNVSAQRYQYNPNVNTSTSIANVGNNDNYNYNPLNPNMSPNVSPATSPTSNPISFKVTVPITAGKTRLSGENFQLTYSQTDSVDTLEKAAAAALWKEHTVCFDHFRFKCVKTNGPRQFFKVKQSFIDDGDLDLTLANAKFKLTIKSLSCLHSICSFYSGLYLHFAGLACLHNNCCMSSKF